MRFPALALALVVASLPAARGQEAAKETALPFKVQGELKRTDPKDRVRKDSPAVLHKLTLKKDKTYKIDLSSKEFDTFLRLEDAAGKQLAFNDDITKDNLNSRIVFQAPADGTYTVVVTSYDGDAGNYVLEVTAASDGGLEARVKGLLKASEAEGQKILAEVERAFAPKKDKLTLEEAQLLFHVANGVEHHNPKLAVGAYEVAGKILAAAGDKKIAAAGKQLEGAGRRMGLVGKEIEVRGTTVDGKPLDWKGYRGKVVLVDFWASWCKPCVNELPNVRKAYEEFKGKGFEVVGVSLDRDREELDDFLKKHKLPWVTVRDEPGKDGAPSLADYYGVLSIPQAILVGRDGRVLSLDARGENLRRLLEEQFAEKK
jgi:peroxiredoxin